MRVLVGIVVAVAVIAACGTTDEPETPTTTTAPVVDGGPQEVVGGWIRAVIASDTVALSELVEPSGLVILAAVENGFTEEETRALLESGIPEELVADYWATFRSGFVDFAGVPLQSIEVGDHDEFQLGRVRFAGVVIRSGDGATSVIVARRDERWRVDLIGSFGPAFAAQLRRMLVNLSDSPAAETIRDTYRSDVVPGLLAAFRRAPGNSVLGAELERMALLLEE